VVFALAMYSLSQLHYVYILTSNSTENLESEQSLTMHHPTQSASFRRKIHKLNTLRKANHAKYSKTNLS